jgi:hypothetical protein
MHLGTNVPRDYFVAFFSPSKSARRKTFQPRTDWEPRHFRASPQHPSTLASLLRQSPPVSGRRPSTGRQALRPDPPVSSEGSDSVSSSSRCQFAGSLTGALGRVIRITSRVTTVSPRRCPPALASRSVHPLLATPLPTDAKVQRAGRGGRRADSNHGQRQRALGG